jgi:DNA-binding transcriptional MerR regulator
MRQLPQSRPDNPIDNSPLLKMKELVEAAGISKATIHYYVNQGLLPKPVKTCTNVAFYPSSFVERLGFIKQLQSRNRLSLAQIKSIIIEKEKGREVTPLIELNDIVFGRKGDDSVNRKQFCNITGLSKTDVTKAIRSKLLNPKDKRQFDSEDIAVGRMLKRSLDLGISFKDLEYYPRLAQQIVEQELAVRKKVIKDKSFDETLVLTMEMTGIARSLRGYVIDRVFQERVGNQQLKGDDSK